MGSLHFLFNFNYHHLFLAPSDNKHRNLKQVLFTKYNADAYLLRKVPMILFQPYNLLFVNQKRKMNNLYMGKPTFILSHVFVERMVLQKYAAIFRVNI